jgi:hypothetical protein
LITFAEGANDGLIRTSPQYLWICIFTTLIKDLQNLLVSQFSGGFFFRQPQGTSVHYGGVKDSAATTEATNIGI